MASTDPMMSDLHHSSAAKAAKRARLYRMVMPGHICPYGQKCKWLLRLNGYDVEDHHLTTREETDSFKREHGVETTPQTWIGDKRIGGYDDLRSFFGRKVHKEGETTYRPVVTLFVIALLIAVAVLIRDSEDGGSFRLLELFVGTAMVLLGFQKLKDIEGFTTMFLNYDLLGQRQAGYAYLYPLLETSAGLLMIASVLPGLAAPIALFIGTIGFASVYKAAYVEKRELKCACMGAGSNTPLGPVTLVENGMMALMGLWMLIRVTF